MSTPTFIVGTGRCGSTMISNMLREHPRVLSVSEYFSMVTANGRIPEAFANKLIDGQKFWSINAAISVYMRYCMQRGISIEEILYPSNDPGFRFSAQQGVPGILVTTLPHIASDPDSLFDMLAAEIGNWPEAMPSVHYARLFDWLARHFGKHLWIERSGNSFEFIERIVGLFPEALFVHIARDGRDTARSMRENPLFRIGYLIGAIERYLRINPLENPDRSHLDLLPGQLWPFLPERFDVDAFNAFRVPLPLCGDLWSKHVEMGLKVLKALEPDRILTLRYEDILVDPKRELDTLTSFLGADYVDQDWSARCAATVRKPKSTWRDLPEDEARALTDACRPGFEALREAGVAYEY